MGMRVKTTELWVVDNEVNDNTPDRTLDVTLTVLPTVMGGDRVKGDDTTTDDAIEIEDANVDDPALLPLIEGRREEIDDPECPEEAGIESVDEGGELEDIGAMIEDLEDWTEAVDGD